MSGTILLILRLILAVCLYSYLFWALFTLWRDFKRQSTLLTRRGYPPITLLRQDLEHVEPVTFIIQEVFVGRDPVCHYFLDDSTISAKHARLFFNQGQWWVEDLHSTNGTFLNQMEISTPLVLSNGDSLRCGQVDFRVLIDESGHQDVDQSASESTELFQ